MISRKIRVTEKSWHFHTVQTHLCYAFQVKFSIIVAIEITHILHFFSLLVLLCLFVYVWKLRTNKRAKSQSYFTVKRECYVILATFGSFRRLSNPMNPKRVLFVLVNKINFSVFLKSENKRWFMKKMWFCVSASKFTRDRFQFTQR